MGTARWTINAAFRELLAMAHEALSGQPDLGNGGDYLRQVLDQYVQQMLRRRWDWHGIIADVHRAIALRYRPEHDESLEQPHNLTPASEFTPLHSSASTEDSSYYPFSSDAWRRKRLFNKKAREQDSDDDDTVTIPMEVPTFYTVAYQIIEELVVAFLDDNEYDNNREGFSDRHELISMLSGAVDAIDPSQLLHRQSPQMLQIVRGLLHVLYINMALPSRPAFEEKRPRRTPDELIILAQMRSLRGIIEHVISNESHSTRSLVGDMLTFHLEQSQQQDTLLGALEDCEKVSYAFTEQVMPLVQVLASTCIRSQTDFVAAIENAHVLTQSVLAAVSEELRRENWSRLAVIIRQVREVVNAVEACEEVPDRTRSYLRITALLCDTVDGMLTKRNMGHSADPRLMHRWNSMGMLIKHGLRTKGRKPIRTIHLRPGQADSPGAAKGRKPPANDDNDNAVNALVQGELRRAVERIVAHNHPTDQLAPMILAQVLEDLHAEQADWQWLVVDVKGRLPRQVLDQLQRQIIDHTSMLSLTDAEQDTDAVWSSTEIKGTLCIIRWLSYYDDQDLSPWEFWNQVDVVDNMLNTLLRHRRQLARGNQRLLVYLGIMFNSVVRIAQDDIDTVLGEALLSADDGFTR